jgi:hypothetical protein
MSEIMDRLTGEVWTIHGTAYLGTGDVDGLFYGDDERGYSVLEAVDFMRPSVVALCAHGYTANDSCPGCDAADDTTRELTRKYGVEVTVHAFGHMIDLGMIYNNADTTWSAIAPSGDILGDHIRSGDSAVRALTLDHKRRVWHTALNEAKTREEASQPADLRAGDTFRFRYSDTTLLVIEPRDTRGSLVVANVSGANKSRIYLNEPVTLLDRAAEQVIPDPTGAVHQWVKTRQLGHAYGMPVAKVAPHDGSQL